MIIQIIIFSGNFRVFIEYLEYPNATLLTPDVFSPFGNFAIFSHHSVNSTQFSYHLLKAAIVLHPVSAFSALSLVQRKSTFHSSFMLSGRLSSSTIA